MIILNLMPYKAREDLRHRLSAEVLLFGVFLSVVMLFDALMLLNVDATMTYTAYQLKGELQSVEASRDLHPLQAEVNILDQIGNEYAFTSKALDSLTRLRPAGVDINSMQLKTVDGSIVMKGTAASIDLVDRMKAALDSSGEFTGNVSSLEDLLSDGRVRFTLVTRAALPHL